MSKDEFITEVKSGDRFEFGKNWKSFLNNLTEEQIQIAKESLIDMISLEDFTEKAFLDLGCGSGLISLSAKMLNAKVYSIDYDPIAVKCASYLRKEFNYNNNNWEIEQGSVLNTEYIKSLPKFDIVYSWGVLHHTGNMDKALNNAIIPVKDDGILFISIYNDQGRKSKFWRKIKRLFNSSFIGKLTVITLFYSYFAIRGLIADIIKLKNPFKRYIEYKKKRGMSLIHDWKDWLGGLPYEVATPEYIIDFYLNRGFTLKKIKTTNTLGCNQFVFKKNENKN